MAVEWLTTLKATTPQGTTTSIATMRRILAQDKGKRNISKSTEAEQSYKFKEDLLVEKVYLEIEAKS